MPTKELGYILALFWGEVRNSRNRSLLRRKINTADDIALQSAVLSFFKVFNGVTFVGGYIFLLDREDATDISSSPCCFPWHTNMCIVSNPDYFPPFTPCFLDT